MNAKTLKALKSSIAKWSGIHAGQRYDMGPRNCALCKLFWKPKGGTVSCGGCPVQERTGRSGCGGTPYDRWLKLRAHGSTANTPKRKAVALAELRFLESLLPK